MNEVLISRKIHQAKEVISFVSKYDVNLRYIQTLLGHESSKTTEIYTYVSDRFLYRIKSSLDVILEGKSMDDKELR